MQPALRALIASEGFAVTALSAPATWRSSRGAGEFAFLPREYGLPAAVAGFEPEDILLAVYDLMRMLSEGRPALVNDYERAVSYDGNALARAAMERVFVPRRDIWRGLGAIDASGLGLREGIRRLRRRAGASALK